MRVSEEFREFRSGNAIFIALLALVFLYESASAEDTQTREIVEQATTNAAEKAAEEATEKVAEMVASEAAAQAEELAAEKPLGNKTPRRVATDPGKVLSIRHRYRWHRRCQPELRGKCVYPPPMDGQATGEP